MKHVLKCMARWKVLIGAVWVTVLPIHAQVAVDASIDSLELLIGEQAKIRLEVSLDADQRLRLPTLNDTLIKGIEIVDIAKPDTQWLNEGKRMLVKEEYTITSFDSALYYLPPFEVTVNDRAYRSKALALKVYSVPVDTLHPDQFFGPKDIRKVRIAWNDIRWIVWLSLILLALAGAEYYLFIRYRDNKPIIRRIHVEPKLPPHERALKEMEEIKSNRALKEHHPKEYYTRLTEVLRSYMIERFGFNAMEMTSSEIIARLMEIKEQDALSDLKSLFKTADLVKFAKLSPRINENDMNLINAVSFINETKTEDDPNTKSEPTEITIVEKRSSKARVILLSCLVIVLVAILVICTLIIGQIRDVWF